MDRNSDGNSDKDYLVSATAENGTVRAFCATTKNTANTFAKHHKTTPVVTVAGGRLLTAVAIIGKTLKNENDLITLSIKGDGPMKGLVATGNYKCEVKAYPYNNYVDIPKKESGNLDVRTAIGNGHLNVIKDMGLKEPYVGNTPLVSGEIADDLTWYYAKSEQIPTSVALGVLVNTDYTVKQSGGFFFQLMPNVKEETISKLEQRLAHLEPISSMLDSGKTPEEILEILFEGMNLKINDKSDISFKCNCSKEKTEKALISIGKKEIQNILDEDAKAEMNCHFCNTSYQFTKEELESIVKSF